MNLDKCQFFQSTVTFAGFKLSSDGYQVDESITTGISQYPTPNTRTDLQSFGLVNQLSLSTDTIATFLAPLRPLLSTKNNFIWSANHDKAFTRAKMSLTKPPVLSFFNVNNPTRLSIDASRQGIGFILKQQSNNKWTLIQAGSRFLTDTESRYATIELEMLVVAWAIQKCKLFLSGLQHCCLLTDHNQLVPISAWTKLKPPSPATEVSSNGIYVTLLRSGSKEVLMMLQIPYPVILCLILAVKTLLQSLTHIMSQPSYQSQN